MSDVQEPPRNKQDDEDQRLFESLDRYVESLHDANYKSRSELLAHHGELAELLGCLDALDSLAIAPTVLDSPSSDSSRHTNPTLVSDTESMSDSTGKPAESPQQPESAAPKVFGNYRLEEEIGRGGMGVVYRAWQQDLDRSVALKMILSSRLASADDVRRFHSEAKAAGSIKHPNIVGIHEVGQINGQHYFTMDYVPGRSLANLIEDGPFDIETAVECVTAVAEAVHFLHEHNIVHRDLKPSNILVDPSGTPFVTDFGLAKVFNADSVHTQTGTIVGTPSYMAPEQAAGRSADISPKSDVYSLGAILYELLSGRPPFQESTPLDTLVQVLEGEPAILSRLNPQVPRELELICLKCLEKAPENRYASAHDLAKDLTRYLRGEPIEARPSGVWHKLRRWVRREPALVSRLAGLLVAAGIVQVTYFSDPDSVDMNYHLQIMSILGLWAGISFIFQRLLHSDRFADAVPFFWAAADAVLLTMLLAVTRGALGPLLIGYPLLVSAAGLFFRVRLVLFMTTACLLSYAALLFAHPEQMERPHYPMIFAAVLAVLGSIVAYQVYRVRILSRYYDRRQIP